MRDNGCGLLLVGLHSSGKTTLSQAFSSTGDYLVFELGDGVREIASRRSQTNLVRIASEVLAGNDPVLLAKMAVAKARIFNGVVPVFVGARTVEERDYLVSCYPRLLVIGLNTPSSTRLARWKKRQMMATDKWEEREQWEALRALRRKLAEEHGVPPYVIFPDSTLLEMLRSKPGSMAEMAKVSGVGARKLERYGEAFLEVLSGKAEAPRVVADVRHELISLARAGMTPTQIAGQLQCSEKNVYTLLAEAIGKQQLSIEQALDLPEDLLGEVQDAFLDGEGELPPVSAIAEQFAGRVPEGVLYCVRAALQSEFEV